MLCSVRRLKQTIPRERQVDEVHITFRVIKCQGICLLLLFYYITFIFLGANNYVVLHYAKTRDSK